MSMLADIERKVLRILWNFGRVGAKRLPTLAEISRKTGRREKEIPPILNRLQDQEYILWDGRRTDSIKILKEWESEADKSTPMSDYSRFMD